MDSFADLLQSLPIGGIGFGGIVTLAIMMVLRGDIVPRSTVESIVHGKDQQIVTLTEALDTSEKARTAGAEADRQLLELGKTTVQLLESIHERANGVKP